MDIDDFTNIKPQLTAVLAHAIERELIRLGDDAKNISWFSSIPFNNKSKEQIA